MRFLSILMFAIFAMFAVIDAPQVTAANRSLQQLATVIERSGGLATLEIDGTRITETALPEIDSGVVATFGRSAATGRILVGLHDDEGIALYTATPADPSSWTFVAAQVVGAQWAPAGDKYLYHTLSGDLILGGPEGSRRIAGRVRAASFSPDGTRLAIVRTSDFSSEVDSEESLRRRLNAAAGERARDRGPAPRPSGLFLYDVATSRETLLSAQVITDWWYLGYAPAWSPDGNQILFVSGWSAANGAPALSIAALEPRRTYALHVNTPVPDPSTPFYWSPDSLRVFVGSESLDGDPQVWSLAMGDPGFADARIVVDGRPALQIDGNLLIESPEGTALLNTVTLELRQVLLERLAIPPDRMPATNAAAASLYDVKYCKPLKSTSVSSYRSHSDAKNGCNDGGKRYDCKDNGSNKRKNHRGTDFPASLGTDIFAAAKGTVYVVKTGKCGPTNSCKSTSKDAECNNGAGNYVWLKHTNGAITKYMHMKKAAMKGAESVTKSTVIGYVGSTGESSGCHVHFQIDFKDVAFDPYYGKCSCTTDSLWTASSCSR